MNNKKLTVHTPIWVKNNNLDIDVKNTQDINNSELQFNTIRMAQNIFEQHQEEFY